MCYGHFLTLSTKFVNLFGDAGLIAAVVVVELDGVLHPGDPRQDVEVRPRHGQPAVREGEGFVVEGVDAAVDVLQSAVVGVLHVDAAVAAARAGVEGVAEAGGSPVLVLRYPGVDGLFQVGYVVLCPVILFLKKVYFLESIIFLQ